jgi:hypothetical protein
MADARGLRSLFPGLASFASAMPGLVHALRGASIPCRRGLSDAWCSISVRISGHACDCFLELRVLVAWGCFMRE